jgi:CubicO group peptidase (beta-lactamase class C family)
VNLGLPPDFGGVVSVSRGGVVEFEQASGLADRAHQIPVTVDTQFAIASGTKAFTAATVLSLVVDGTLDLATTARSLLGADLPLIADDVTIEHLLTHRSGIGDYVDEDLDDEPELTVSVQSLETTESYLPALAGFPTKFAAGTRFSYCNSGYVVLALIAERAAEHPFGALVTERALTPAGMVDTAFLRSDELPGRAAIGYLDDGRTNVFKLPVVGSGDGGIYTTAADIRRFWPALLEGRIVPAEWAQRMTRPSSNDTGHPYRYGMGFWIDDGARLILDGGDYGVSFRSVHDPSSDLTVTVMCNTMSGAATVSKALLASLS